MTDRHALPDSPKTPRADPLQPDQPGRGSGASPSAPEPAASDDDESPQRQSQRALENVREGYGGPSADEALPDAGRVQPTPAQDGSRTAGGSSYGDYVPDAKRKAERTSPGTVDTPETMTPAAPDPGPGR